MTYENVSSDETDFEQRIETGPFDPNSLIKKVRRSADGYEPGAIRKVTLENFVTYKHAVFSIGPSLNMIIGPNGSGKSTIVCAICLALGGKPEILGRAKAPVDFIRHGEETATIAIELQNHIKPSTKATVTLTRTISKSSSTWRIDRRSCTAKDVIRKVAEFNIQIDNLCQFLPQDKVASFAGLPSTELLLETERAVGSERMVKNHKNLIVLDDNHQRLQKELEISKEKLEKAEELQAADQELIDKINERENTIRELEVVKVCIDALEYREIQKQKVHADSSLKTAQERFDEMSAKKNEFEEKAREFSEKHDEITGRMDQVQAKRQQVQERFSNACSNLDSEELKLKSLKARYASVKKSMEHRAEMIREVSKKIDGLKESLKAAPEPDKQEKVQIDEELTQLRNEISSIRTEVTEIEDKQAPFIRKLNAARASLRQEEQHKSTIRSLSERRLNALKFGKTPQMKDTYEAIIWLHKDENRALFRERILEPPMVTLNYKDNGLLDLASAAIDGNTMLTFTAQNREDYVTFSREVIDKMKFNISIREYSKTDYPKLSDQIRPFGTKELQSYGLSGVILDFLEGPAPVLNMLCHSCKVNAIPYCAGNLTSEEIEHINSLTRKNGDPLFTKYFDRTYYVSLSRSRHGQKLISSSTSKLQKHTDRFVVEGSNSEELAAMNAKINAIQERIQELEGEIDQFSSQIQAIKEKKDPIRRQMEEVERRRVEYKKNEQLHRTFVTRLENSMNQKQELESQPDTTLDEYKEIDREMESICKKIIGNVRNTKKLLKLLHDLEMQYTSLVIERNITAQGYKYYNEFATRGLEEVSQQLEAAQARYNEIIVEFRTIKKQVKNAIASLSEEDQATVKAAHEDENLSVDDLRDRKNQLEFKLSSTEDEQSGAALQRYEKRQKQIEEYTQSIDEMTDEDNKITTHIAEIRQQWEPELKLIVQTISREFSKAFESINCRGEVVLGNTDKTFKEWSMDIMVSFRHDSELQVLTHQRQSGGERAVSTIFYLISLQRLTKSPFRVVDEINQGMDPRNERVVHSHMVSVACAEDSSQYFLITPKLLQDLTYDRKMKVHIIVSGPHVTDVSEYKEPPSSAKKVLEILRASAN